MIPKLLEGLEESKSKAHMIREAMPWVSEQEQQDLIERVESTRSWIDSHMEEQNKLALTDEPHFTMDELNKEMEKLTKLSKKIFGKKKPKEKKPKKEKKDEDEEAKDD